MPLGLPAQIHSGADAFSPIHRFSMSPIHHLLGGFLRPPALQTGTHFPKPWVTDIGLVGRGIE
jgi:hypothetical protein